MKYVYNDGGRKVSGRRGEADDCVTRAIAIAAELPYAEVYAAINDAAKSEKTRRGRLGMLAATGRGSSARSGVYKATYAAYIESLGWTWHPTMRVGQGCTTHLRAGELPAGRLIVKVSKHLCAVIDGVIHDTENPSRDGTRCVYGYYSR